VETLAVNVLDPADLIATFGLIGVLAIIFAETGLLVGFFFPGDSLLFLAGVAASPFVEAVIPGAKPLNIAILLIGTPLCAIAGAQLGHWFGARYGRKMFDRPNSRLFKPEYVEKAEYYFNKFGPAKAVILARFIPIVRTFLNPVAGVLEMPARKFFLYNVIGAVLWCDGILLVGYLLAERLAGVPNIDRYILPAVAVIILISVMPILIEIYRGWRAKRAGVAIPTGSAASAGASTTTSTTTSNPSVAGSGEGRHRAAE
jgi:membrane-associated protein